MTSVNRAGERLTGYRSDELVGKLAIDLIAPDRREQALRQFKERLGRTEAGPDESMLMTRDGRRVPIEVTSAVLCRDGRPVAVLGLVSDLTERKGAESALHQSEERFRALLEAAPDAKVIVDATAAIEAGFLQERIRPDELPPQTAADAHTNGAGLNSPDVSCVVADDHPAVLDSVSRFLESHGFNCGARLRRQRGAERYPETAADARTPRHRVGPGQRH